jgi:hypothetical protein
MGSVSVKILDVLLLVLGYEIEFKQKCKGFGIPTFG